MVRYTNVSLDANIRFMMSLSKPPVRSESIIQIVMVVTAMEPEKISTFKFVEVNILESECGAQ